MSVISGSLGAIMGSQATQAAAKEQAEAAKYAANLQKKAFDEQLAYTKEQNTLARADLAPYRETGTEALGRLRDLNQPGGDFQRDFTLADFEADPGYQFRLAEGQKALERSAAARGGVLSGRQLKDLTRFGQDTASAEYGAAYTRFLNNRTTRFNRLAALAGIGQTATNTTGQFGQAAASAMGNAAAGYANAAGELALQGANARASGYIGGANAWSQGLSNATAPLRDLGTKALSNWLFPPSAGTLTYPTSYVTPATASPTMQPSGYTAPSSTEVALQDAQYLAYF
jgi:hypothetical protein